MAEKSEKKSNLSHWFNTAALALAIDLLFVFPVSHTSLIGKAITNWSGSLVVPPLDWLATDVFGMVDPSAEITSNGGTGLDVDTNVAEDEPMPDPFK